MLKKTEDDIFYDKNCDNTEPRATSSNRRPVAAVEPVPRVSFQLDQHQQQQHASPAPSLHARRAAANHPRGAMMMINKRQTVDGGRNDDDDDDDKAIGDGVEVVNCKTCCYVGRISRRMSVRW